MTAYMKNYCIRIYETDGTEIWYTDENYWNETVGYRRDEYNIYLEKRDKRMKENVLHEI